MEKEGTKLLYIYVFITIIGIIGYLYGEDGTSTAWRMYVVLGSASTLGLAIIAGLGYMKYIKEEDIVIIKFKPTFKIDKIDDEGNITTGLTVMRKNCTRSEIQGLLGMIFNNYHKRNRYDLEDFLTLKGKKNILTRIDDAQKGKSNEVVISITKEELKQFNI